MNLEAQRFSFDPKQALERSMERGGVEFVPLSASERVRLRDALFADWSHVSPDVRVQVLEQCVLHELIDDAALLGKLESASPEERRTLGEYLGRASDPKKFLKSFYQCWTDLSPEQRQEFTRAYTQRPEDVICVAPFVDVPALRFPKRDEKTGEVKQLNCFQFAFTRFEEMGVLLDAVLSYREPRPFGVRIEKDPVKQLFEFVASGERSVFAMPFAERAHALGMQTDNLVRVAKEPRAFDGLHFLKQEELALSKRYLERVQQVIPAADDWTIYTDSPNLSPATQDEMLRLGFELKKREIGVLADFYRSTRMRDPQLLPPPLEYVMQLAQRNIPSLPLAEAVELAPDDCLTLVQQLRREGEVALYTRDGADIATFLAYVRRTNPDVGRRVEQEIVDDAREAIGLYGADCYMSTALVRKNSPLRDSLPPDDRKQLLAMIDEQAPELWLANIPLALERGTLAFDVMVKQAARNNPTELLKQLADAQAELRALGKTDEVKHLNTTARQLFQMNPEFFYAKNIGGFARGLVQPEERTQWIRRAITVARGRSALVLSVLQHPSEDLALQEECRAIVRDPDFVQFAIWRGDIDKLAEVLPKSEVVRLAFLHTDPPIKHLAKMSWVLEELVEKPVLLNRFFRLVAAQADESVHSDIGYALATVRRDDKKKKRQAEWRKLEERLAVILRDWCQATPGFVFERGVLTSLGKEAYPFVARDIEAMAALQPECLFQETPRGGVYGSDKQLVVMAAVGKERYVELLRQHGQEISVSGEAVSAIWRSPEARSIVERVFPHHLVSRWYGHKFTNAEAYQPLIDSVSKSVFFPWYRDALRDAAIQSKGRYSYRASDQYPTDEFLKPLVEISNLTASPLAKENQAWLLALDEESRQRLLPVLLEVIRVGVDETGLVFEGRSVAEVIHALRELQRAPLLRQLEDLSVEGRDMLPVETLHALVIYRKNACAGDNKMTTGFRSLLGAFGSGFEAWRAWGGAVEPGEQGAALERMKREGLLPRKLDLERYMTWLEPMQTTSEEEFQFEGAQVASAVSDLFSQAIADGHITGEDLLGEGNKTRIELDRLSRPLQEWTQRRQELTALFAKARKAKKAGTDYVVPTEADEREHAELQQKILGFLQEHGAEITKRKAQLYVQRLETISMTELDEQVLRVEKERVPFARVFSIIREGLVAAHPVLEEDVKRVEKFLEDTRISLLGGTRVSRQTLHFSDAIDAVTYFHIGEFPVPSCQNWNGTKHFNRGLLSYETDPNVRFVLIRDAAGQLIGRAALRLLEDPEQKPALFLERLYSTNVHPKVKELAVRFALKKAAQLGVELYSSFAEGVVGVEEDGDAADASGYLRSRGSRSGFVYTDAGGGLRQRGDYTILSPIRVPQLAK